MADKEWFIVSIDRIEGHNFSRQASWLPSWFSSNNHIDNPCIRITSSTRSINPQKTEIGKWKGTKDNPVWETPFHNRLHIDPKATNKLAFTIYDERKKDVYKKIATKTIMLPDKEETSKLLTVEDFPGAPNLRLDVLVTAKFEPCLFKSFTVKEYNPIVSIKKIEGYNFSKGWFHFYRNTPSPYIVVSCRKSSECRSRTDTIPHQSNPIWNDPFKNKFYFDPKEEIELSVWDENLLSSQHLSTKTIILPKLNENSEGSVVVNFDTNPGGMSLKLTLDVNSDRYY